MANTYTQVHIHFVFAVKYRACLIEQAWKTELYKYMTGIVQNNGHKLIAINGMADHIHILAGVRPSQSFSELMQDVKASSSKWINENKMKNGEFRWQEGFGAFAYSKSDLKNVINYIENQEQHHSRRSFRDEYLELLRKEEVAYDEKYIFQELI